ncbi:MAG: hypothetical protein HFH39_11690 [Lachnospiraceae bacterium]|nr:hypothetical protein [Bacilli bacterium]MCI9005869.1 hypothetical protein [Lachnospiraceae bacterium]
MAGRIDLHKVLCWALGSEHVYYQPPESVKMEYPAIVYARSNIENTFADNGVYAQSHAYEVTVIDRDPDSEVVARVSLLPMCRFNRHYKADNLNHDVFVLYY